MRDRYYCYLAARCIACKCLANTEERRGTPTTCPHCIFCKWWGVIYSRSPTSRSNPGGTKFSCPRESRGFATLRYSYSFESLCREERLEVLEGRWLFGTSSMRGELLHWNNIEIARLYNWKMKNSKPNFITSCWSNYPPINNGRDYSTALVCSWTLHPIYYPTAGFSRLHLLSDGMLWSRFRTVDVLSWAVLFRHNF